MLLSRLRRTIREHDLARPGTRVAVAVSGGPDSVALAHLIGHLSATDDLVFAGIVHFNHRLRPTAERDEAFARDLAASLGVPFDVESADVARIARQGHRSIEDAAHEARYGFYGRARTRLAADVVALGHTRDDQAETFLLRLVRGAGARGLAAMHPRHEFVIRPLLDCRRTELLAWLRARDLPFMTDETNADVSIPRNRVRAELLPLLETRFNPAVVDVLAGAAEIARAEWHWLEQAADEQLRLFATASPGRLEVDAAALRALPVALRRVVLWRAMSQFSSRPVTFTHVDAAVKLLDKPAAHLDVPGQSLERAGDRLVLTGRSAEADRPPAKAETNLFEYSLSIPGEVAVPEAGGILSAVEGGGLPGGEPFPAPVHAVVRRDLCGSRLMVRNRRPGDRLRPVGLKGRKKLQDLFVDRKIARADRDRIPLVVDETGRILWVAGFGIAAEFRVTDPAQPMLILRFKSWGGSA